jgi:hypothetical protein
LSGSGVPLAWLAHTPVAKLAGPLLDLGTRRRSPFLIALGLALRTRRIGGASSRSSPVGHLVVLQKAGTTDDVLAAAAGRGGDTIRISTLTRRPFRTLFKAVTGTTGATGITDSDYRYGIDWLEAPKLEYRRLLVEVLIHYRRFTGVDAITSANVRYRAERELAAACAEVGIAFVPLHKESISTRAQRGWIVRGLAELAGPFMGQAVAVYNDEERDGMVEAGFAAHERIAVVGCPRIDRLHRVRERSVSQADETNRPIVLFSIDVKAGVWTPFDGRLDTGAPNWERLAALTEEAFVTAARLDPDRPYLIKAKIGREDQQVDRLPYDLPTNVRVLTGGLATDLIERAAVIVGFNSTVLLEAVATGVPTIVPRFGEAADPAMQDWILELDGAVRSVHSPADLPGALREAAAAGRSRGLTTEAVEALERYVGNADGRAGERAWAFLSEATTSARRAR